MLDREIQEAAEEVVESLGIDRMMKKIETLNDKLDGKTAKRVSNFNLEDLMTKDVNDMTSEEKIVGFFQAALQNNTVALKALSEGTPASGGYLIPEEFRSEVVRSLGDGGYMRNEVRVVQMKRDTMNIPSLASRPKVTWTEENAVKSTTTAHFGQITLTVKKMAAILYSSDELIDDSEADLVKLIVDLFAETIGEEEDRVICQGNGTTQPTGLVTARTATTIASVACEGNLDFDDILNLVYLLPNKYHKTSKFYVNRNNIKELRKLKDDNGRYVWADPISAGVPPTIFGYPVIEANDLPESEIYFGDLKKAYWLGDRHQMRVKISQDTTQAFTQDETAIRVVERLAGNVVLADAVRALITIP